MAKRDLAFLSISEIGRLFRSRKLSPVELTRHFLARIERINPELNTYLTVASELALAQARQAEKELFAPRSSKSRRDRGPLHGIPISLKDNIHAAGIWTTAGAKFLKDFVPDQDAAIVSKLKVAGAIFLGKTNLHEFAYGVTTNNPHYGVVGFKPTLRRVSVEGIVPLSPTLDCAGPLARSLDDSVLVLSAIAAPSEGEPPLTKALASKANKNFTLGVPKEFFFDVLSPEVRDSLESNLKLLRKRGFAIKEISIPLLNHTESAGNNIAWAEATRYHQKMDWFPRHSAEYGEDVRSRLEIGARIAATTYLEALEQRDAFIAQFHSALSDAKVDALIVPSTPIPAPLIGEESTTIDNKDYATRALLLRLNRPANLAGLPAISLPCGLTSSGLPLGLQLMGARTSEPRLVKIARQVETSMRPISLPEIG
jgi:aspartyl-tRNA(Asn)/glutamyl-tRNA(Gln) amidotransferase subunit A